MKTVNGMEFIQRLQQEFQAAKDNAYQMAKDGKTKEFEKWQIKAETIEKIIDIAKYYL